MTHPKTFVSASITRDAATELIAAARKETQKMGIVVAIAVTDASGHLKAFEREDNAPLLAVDVAIDKAWTAASFGLATHTWNAILEDKQVSQLAHRPRLVSVGGGCPILDGGRLVGAIGISGGNAQQDREAAEKALASLGFDVQA